MKNRSHLQTEIPRLVRVKPGALNRVGAYAARYAFRRVAVYFSDGFSLELRGRLREMLCSTGTSIAHEKAVDSIEVKTATQFAQEQASNVDAVIGFGGGKALDVAKYVAFLSKRPYLAIPTSLSNDGFCSPQSSLTIDNKRRSMPSTMPFGVIIDTEVCLQAPPLLWLSGVGDLVAKLTAVEDWKLAFHADGTEVDDFAALLSDASVYQLMSRPTRDLEGMKLLGTALMLNGIAMSICGSSRPASGSEHLISHALDANSKRPCAHGLQVGVATYLISLLQGNQSQLIASLFEKTGFWSAIAEDPFDREEWIEAARLAPELKRHFYTVLTSRDCLPEIRALLDSDPWLRRCFV